LSEFAPWLKGNYGISGTIGQPDAGLANGGVYDVQGGFRQSQLMTGYSIYLPVVSSAKGSP